MTRCISRWQIFFILIVCFYKIFVCLFDCLLVWPIIVGCVLAASIVFMVAIFVYRLYRRIYFIPRFVSDKMLSVTFPVYVLATLSAPQLYSENFAPS